MITPDMFGDLRAQANLLPADGTVNDHGIVISPALADEHFSRLLREAPWAPDLFLLNGEVRETARHVVWYARHPSCYIHSGVRRQASPWNAHLLDELCGLAESVAGSRFNSCLLNLYHHGGEGMAWHSDPEATGKRSVIASLSLGATRRFAFRHKRSGDRRALLLHHGQMIVMRDETQQHWLHSLPKSAGITQPRISLTFRLITDQDNINTFYFT